MLRASFHENDFEIHVAGKSTVILYAWNVGKEQIWQAVADFESTNMKAGFGFGDKKAEAKAAAENVLEKWLSVEQRDWKLSTS